MLDNDLLRWMKTPASQINDLTAENEYEGRTDTNLSMSVVDFAAEKETSETFERHVSSENIKPEEISEVPESKDDTDLSPQPDSLQIEEETPQNKPLLTPEEEAATWKDYKGILFDELNKQETVSGMSYDLENKFTHEMDISVDKNEDETSQSFKHRKKSAVALADEFRRNQKIVSEKVGRMRKKRLMILLVGLILLIALTVTSVSFFSSAKTGSTVDSDLNKSVYSSDNNVIDINVNKLDVEKFASDDLKKTSPDIESEHEEPNYVTVVDSEDNRETIQNFTSSDIRQNTAVTKPEEHLIVSEDSDRTKVKTTLSSETIDLKIASADSTDISKSPAHIDDKVNAKKTTGEIKRTATDTKKIVNRTKTKTIRPKKTTVTESKKADKTLSKNSGSQVKLTVRELPKGVDSRQDKIYSAIENKKYVEAVNLSKINLEQDPNDKLSFFSLGLALYAMSDFSGATEAFYTCLKFQNPALPDFMVEEFDSAESLKNLYIDYPGVDLLIRAVELNPQNKSLYCNLFLSNLKSEKPRAASEIYSIILNHAKKHGLNK